MKMTKEEIDARLAFIPVVEPDEDEWKAIEEAKQDEEAIPLGDVIKELRNRRNRKG